MVDTYRVIRHFADGEREVMAIGLELVEAQEHCNHPDTSSSTATSPEAIALTQERGPWFDGYVKE